MGIIRDSLPQPTQSIGITDVGELRRATHDFQTRLAIMKWCGGEVAGTGDGGRCKIVVPKDNKNDLLDK